MPFAYKNEVTIDKSEAKLSPVDASVTTAAVALCEQRAVVIANASPDSYRLLQGPQLFDSLQTFEATALSVSRNSPSKRLSSSLHSTHAATSANAVPIIYPSISGPLMTSCTHAEGAAHTIAKEAGASATMIVNGSSSEGCNGAPEAQPPVDTPRPPTGASTSTSHCLEAQLDQAQLGTLEPPVTPPLPQPNVDRSLHSSSHVRGHQTPPTPSDPDYEVPRGILTETQVLLSLTQERQQQNRPVRIDRYGFVVTVREGADGGGTSARHVSGGDATTSGRVDDGALLPHILRKRLQRRQHLQLQQQSVGRLRKWRKMLGDGGAAMEAYRQQRPEKLKRRVRKGVPDELRGLAWLALSGGRKLFMSQPGVFAQLTADEEAAGQDPSGTDTSTTAAGQLSSLPAAAAATAPGAGQEPAGTGTEAVAAEGQQPTETSTAAAAPGVQRSHMCPNPGSGPPPVTGRLDPSVDASIMRDLNRTFPNNIYYMQRQGPGQKALYTVLRAYALYDSRVGYVQGMGFLAAVLLLYMDAEKAFWTLVAMLQGPSTWPDGETLKLLYTPGMPGLQCCLYQFRYLLRDVVPRLAVRMEREGVDPSLYATHWFNTAFAYSLPFGHLLRVWDVFLAEGVKTIFRVGLAVLKNAEARLIGLPFELLMESLSAKNLHALLPEDPEMLMRLALSIPVSRRLRELRAEWQTLQRHGQQHPNMRAKKRGARRLKGLR